MSEVNRRTLETYNSHVDQYVATTPHEVSGDIKEWIDRALDGMSLDLHILEFGSAFGRDATYIESLGYTVDRTDASRGFVDLLRSSGYVAEVLDITKDEIPCGYDFIFANAVLLHLQREDSRKVMAGVHDALNPLGKFVFSLKIGDGDGWSTDKLGAPRFFCYWQEPELTEALRTAGFTDNNTITSGVGVRSTPWLHVIANKTGQTQ